MFGSGAQAQLVFAGGDAPTDAVTEAMFGLFECHYDEMQRGVGLQIGKVYAEKAPEPPPPSRSVRLLPMRCPYIGMSEAIIPVMADPAEQARIEAYYDEERRHCMRDHLYYGRHRAVRPWQHVIRVPKRARVEYEGPIAPEIERVIEKERAHLRLHFADVLSGGAKFDPFVGVRTTEGEFGPFVDILNQPA